MEDFLTATVVGSKNTERVMVSEDIRPSQAGGALPAKRHCYHCGTPLRGALFTSNDKAFCCRGCQTVFDLLTENGLADFYQLGEAAGVRIKAAPKEEAFKYLDEASVRERLVDFTNGRMTRVTFRIPAIHCIACVWLLENLFRIQPGIGQSQVNFPRREAAITFEDARVKLSEVVALLTSLGYEPELKYSDLEGRPKSPASRRIWLQLGIAGFAFGNIMLFSISAYLGLDAFAGPGFRKMVGVISLILTLPVVLYSALDYWLAAWTSLKQRLLNIDVPIAAGVVAIFAQSCYEVLSGRGDGYFDSLCGLIFFLLCGRLFQQKTYDRLVFDRDYKSFFPLAVRRRSSRSKEAQISSQESENLLASATVKEEEQVSLAQLAVGDRLVIRNGELIPADAKLVSGPGLIDYSFVTGESEPVEKKPDDYLYAGGRQMGGAIEVETVKAVSQSYLTSLWNQEVFRKDKQPALNTITNIYSHRFTKLVVAIALGAAGFWAFVNPAISLRAFTSVLIVACPCALALAAPFALGTAQRVLGRRNVFLKNSSVIETLARVNAVVFDKTGTLTAAGAGAIAFHGTPLTEAEERWLYSMTRHTTHPYAVRIGEAIAHGHGQETVRSFRETPGCGMEGTVAGNEIWMGSAAWLESRGVRSAAFTPHEASLVETLSDSVDPVGHGMLKRPEGRAPVTTGSVVHVAINREYRGRYELTGTLRPQTRQLIANLSAHYELALLSGDNERERERFSGLFGPSAHLQFNQSPLNKLGFIRQIQESGKTVMMVGDGLNDAGALRQSDAGVAVVENISAFSPASDAIMAAGMLPRLHEVLRFSKATVRIVRLSFLISSVYNVVGIAIAASGRLSPVICAILMPLSSVTVVAFACGVTSWRGRRIGWSERTDDQASDMAGSPQLAANKFNPSHPVFATEEMQP